MPRLASPTDYYVQDSSRGVVHLRHWLNANEVMKKAGIQSEPTFTRRKLLLRQHCADFKNPKGSTQFTEFQAWCIWAFEEWVREAEGDLRAATQRLIDEGLPTAQYYKRAGGFFTNDRNRQSRTSTETQYCREPHYPD